MLTQEIFARNPVVFDTTYAKYASNFNITMLCTIQEFEQNVSIYDMLNYGLVFLKASIDTKKKKQTDNSWSLAHRFINLKYVIISHLGIIMRYNCHIFQW